MSEPTIYVKAQSVRYRFDKFGGLAWTPLGSIYKLNFKEVSILSLFESPRLASDFDNDIFETDCNLLIQNLLHNRLIEITSDKPISIRNEDLVVVKNQIEKYSSLEINRPFWVHLQPFRFCNQKCIHCYCNSDSEQSKFILSLSQWRSLVDKLYDMGVLEIYLTGGENLIVEDCIELMRYIFEKGFITGLSTNGMRIPPYTYDAIKDLKIDYVQVSLDGSTSDINDPIRGTHGAFDKTTKNIRKLTEITTPVINMVVNRNNIHDIQNMILLGKNLGTNMFRFFPQKSCGRGVDQKQLKVSEEEWTQIQFDDLAKQYDVEIDYLKIGASCGFGMSGFAVNEFGEMFACIYGIENKKLKIGDALEEDIEDLWFNSSIMNQFRNMSDLHPCTRCE